MIELSGIGDYLGMLAIAAGLGGFGGLLGELIEERKVRKRLKPGPEGKAARRMARRGRGFGRISAILIGAGAAVAILVLVSPIDEVMLEGGGVERSYSLVELVSIALIAGSAGSAVFLALQTRQAQLLEREEQAEEKVVEAEKQKVQAETAASATKVALESVTDQVEEVVNKQVAATVEERMQEVAAEEAESAVPRVGVLTRQVAEESAASARETIEGHVAAAQRMIDAVTSEPEEGGPAPS